MVMLGYALAMTVFKVRKMSAGGRINHDRIGGNPPCKGMVWLALLSLIPFFATAQLVSERIVTNHPANDRHPSWSPGGDKIVFESDRQGKWGLYTMEADGANVACLLCDGSNNRNPSFHPEGERVLFESDRDGGIVRLYVIHQPTNRVERVLESEDPQQFGVYSPNGRYVAYTSPSSALKGSFYLGLADVTSKEVIRLTPDAMRALYPAWSPDGKYISFFSRGFAAASGDNIYRMAVEGRELEKLTSSAENNFCPAWFSNTVIVYAGNVEGIRSELFSKDIVSLAIRRLTNNTEVDTEPNVCRRTGRIAWTGFRSGNFEILVAESPH